MNDNNIITRDMVENGIRNRIIDIDCESYIICGINYIIMDLEDLYPNSVFGIENGNAAITFSVPLSIIIDNIMRQLEEWYERGSIDYEYWYSQLA